MKRITIVICLMYIAINIYSFPVFQDYSNFEYVDYLIKKGCIEIVDNDIPIFSEKIIEKLFENNNYLSKNDINIASFLITALERRDKGKINDQMKIELLYNNSWDYKFNNIVNVYWNLNSFFIETEMNSNYPYTEATYKDTILKRIWNNSSSKMSKGYIGYRNKNIYILAGRFLPAWGRGVYDNMFFSSEIQPLDGIVFKYEKGFFDFAFITASLTPNYRTFRFDSLRKYASFHKIGFKLPYKTYFAFKEVIVYSDNKPQWFYSNPFTLYYGVQWNNHLDDNCIWSLEMINKYIDGLTISGELFIDDFIYEKEIEALFSDFHLYAPDKIGLLINFSYTPLFIEGLLIESEYARINKYIGTHRHMEVSYSYYTDPIFHSIGPDADFLIAKVKYFLSNYFIAEYNIIYQRNGEGNISEPFIEMSSQNYEFNFPSGIVEKTMINEVSMLYRYNIFELQINAGYSMKMHKDNIPYNFEEIFFFGLQGIMNI